MVACECVTLRRCARVVVSPLSHPTCVCVLARRCRRHGDVDVFVADNYCVRCERKALVSEVRSGRRLPPRSYIDERVAAAGASGASGAAGAGVKDADTSAGAVLSQWLGSDVASPATFVPFAKGVCRVRVSVHVCERVCARVCSCVDVSVCPCVHVWVSARVCAVLRVRACVGGAPHRPPAAPGRVLHLSHLSTQDCTLPASLTLAPVVCRALPCLSRCSRGS